MCSLHILGTCVAVYRKGLDGSVCGKITRPREQILSRHNTKVRTLDGLTALLVVSRIEKKEGRTASLIHEFLSKDIEAASSVAYRRQKGRLRLRGFVNKINRMSAATTIPTRRLDNLRNFLLS